MALPLAGSSAESGYYVERMLYNQGFCRLLLPSGPGARPVHCSSRRWRSWATWSRLLRSLLSVPFGRGRGRPSLLLGKPSRVSVGTAHRPVRRR